VRLTIKTLIAINFFNRD